MNDHRYAQGFVLVIACLLVAASVAMAQEPEKSPIKIGGAIGVNLLYGDYDDLRGEGVGDVRLDVFRLNADLDYQNVIGRVEYRWYEGYNMFHTAWLGYDWGSSRTLKAGIVRVPYRTDGLWCLQQLFFRSALLCRAR